MANRRSRDVTSRAAVLAAIAEAEEKGPAAFRAEYGFGEATQYHLVHDGREYDPKAIMGVAYARQHDEPPLRAAEFSGGTEATRPLEALGFEVRRDPDRNSEPSSTTSPTP